MRVMTGSNDIATQQCDPIPAHNALYRLDIQPSTDRRRVTISRRKLADAATFGLAAGSLRVRASAVGVRRARTTFVAVQEDVCARVERDAQAVQRIAWPSACSFTNRDTASTRLRRCERRMTSV
jgi:hypothetical protein